VAVASRCTTLGLIVTASALTAAESSPPTVNLIWLTVSQGYRSIALDWNNSGDGAGHNPNIANEWSFRDIAAYQTSIGISTSRGMLHMRGALDYSVFATGSSRISAYGADDRGSEYDRSINDADRGWEANFLGAAGIRIDPVDSLRLTPEVGYCFRSQEFHLRRGVQSVPESGPYSGLDTLYNTQWSGPLFGCTMSWRFARRWVANARFDYFRLSFAGIGNLNLRSDLVHPRSFEQEADGEGLTASIGIAYLAQRDTLLFVRYEWEEWSASGGSDRLNYADGTVTVTRLNQVDYATSTVAIGFSRGF
jgi:hypothetical protein